MERAVTWDDLRGIRGEYQRASVTYPALHSPPHALSRRSFERKIEVQRRGCAPLYVPSFLLAYLPSAYYIHTYIRVQRHRCKAGIIQCKQREAETL